MSEHELLDGLEDAYQIGEELYSQTGSIRESLEIGYELAADSDYFEEVGAYLDTALESANQTATNAYDTVLEAADNYWSDVKNDAALTAITTGLLSSIASMRTGNTLSNRHIGETGMAATFLHDGFEYATAIDSISSSLSDDPVIFSTIVATGIASQRALDYFESTDNN